jgi:CheY-like chemotaxis protein
MSRLSKQLRVFVVDEEDVIASSLAMILRFQGCFHATSFTNPLKARKAAHAEAPDLLITDVVMPGCPESSWQFRCEICIPIAKYCCFPAGRPQPIYSKPQGPQAIALSFCRNRCIRPIFSPGSRL